MPLFSVYNFYAIIFIPVSVYFSRPKKIKKRKKERNKKKSKKNQKKSNQKKIKVRPIKKKIKKICVYNLLSIILFLGATTVGDSIGITLEGVASS